MKRFGPPRFSTLASSIPVWVFAAGLLATALGGVYARETARAKDQLRFDNAVQHVSAEISGRVDTYVALLRAGAGLFAALGDVTPEQFKLFADRLALRERYPGMQGIGFAIRVPASRLPAFLAEARRRRPGFRVWPDYPRNVYFPIYFLEPQDRRNAIALGYDMFEEATRRAAMEAAARRRTAWVSGPVTLVQEIDEHKQAGFLIYAPVYATGDGEGATGGDDLRGFIYSPLRAGDFLSKMMDAKDMPPVSVAVYDRQKSSETLLYDSHSPAVEAGSRFAASATIPVAGRSWVVEVKTLPAFERSAESRLLPWLVALGLLVTFGLTWATHLEVKARKDAEFSADRLRRSEEALRANEAELHRVVEAERRAHAEAAAANRAKDSFLATLSHELRTPLNAILGWSAMLRDGRLSDQQRRRALDVIARSARTQADLIEDLLDVSRIITGKMAIEMQEIRLGGPVRAAVDAVRPTAEAKGVRLEREVLSDPPVLGDPDRLQQVTWNLLSNAIKFTPPGGRVSVILDQRDGQAVLRVADTGMGISPAFLPHVFERFRQHDSSTTREHGGMGLGLAIVRHLVEAHGGSVHAESAGDGQGATFVVQLPVRADTARPAHPEPRLAASRPLRRGEAEIEGLHVLVVDDDPAAREMMMEIFRAEGALVRVAASVREALDILDRTSLDLIVADIGMPEMDGYGLMREVRNHPSPEVRSLPALAVTAYAAESDRRAALAAGYQEHLAKPVDLDTLRSIVRRLVTV